MVKSVEYAYPSSPSAERFGFGKIGCYVVELLGKDGFPRAISGHKTRSEAMAVARNLKQEWKALFLALRQDWIN